MVDRILRERYEIQRQLKDRFGQETLLALDLQTHDFVVVKLLTFSSELKWETFKLSFSETELKQIAKAILEVLIYLTPRSQPRQNSGKWLLWVRSRLDS